MVSGFFKLRSCGRVDKEEVYLVVLSLRKKLKRIIVAPY